MCLEKTCVGRVLALWSLRSTTAETELYKTHSPTSELEAWSTRPTATQLVLLNLCMRLTFCHYWAGSLAGIIPQLSLISIASLSMTEPKWTACIHQNFWVHPLQHRSHKYAVSLWIIFLITTVSQTMVLLLQLMSWHSGAHEPPLLSACLYACLWPLRSLCNRNADATEFAIWSLCYAVSMPVTVSTVLRHCCLYSVSLLGLRRTSPDSPKPVLSVDMKNHLNFHSGIFSSQLRNWNSEVPKWKVAAMSHEWC